MTSLATINPQWQQRLSANISIMFTEVPFLQRFELAAASGFKAVECWFPYEWPAAQIKQLLADNGLTLVGLNTAPGDTTQGDWGLAVNPAKQQQFRAGVMQALEYAVQLNCRNVHVMAGQVAPATPTTADGLMQIYQANIAWAAGQAASAGKTVLIEPLNPIDRPTYFLQRQSQARAVVDALELPNLKIMFDVYHVQMTEGRIASTLQANLPHIGHVQIADVPGRHEPGTGEINFGYVLAQIIGSAYFKEGGWIGCEYKPLTTSQAGLQWIGQVDGQSKR